MKDRPHILASHWCETCENFYILILLQWGELFWDFTLKKLDDDVYQYKYIYSFYVADQDTARYNFCSVQEKCVSLAEPYTTDI